ncbi:MAG: flagellin, partial [Synergistaceae bacterium]|nr:flagellin [Synergistaceae bacterium]
LTLLDAAIRKVSIQRSKLGSYQNELEYNTNSLTETSLNMRAAESRVKDADMATEYMNFVKLQILTQTGNSMLSQANQSQQSIMGMINS